MKLPLIKTLSDGITRKRNKELGFVAVEKQDIPEALRYDHEKNLFLRYDSGYNDDDRFIIFFSAYKENFAAKIKIWQIDGTFKVAPSGFYQLLTLQGKILGKTATTTTTS